MDAMLVELSTKFGDIYSGFVMLASLANILVLLIGIPLGIIIGAIPGLGPTMIIAIAVPLTYSMAPLTAIVLLLGIYVGGIYGGSITAILINTPGTAASAATVLDGFPMTKQGKSGKALHVALKASSVGNVVSILILMFTAFPLARLALEFGSVEKFSLLIFALTIIGGVSGKSLCRGLVAACFGLLLATVGQDPISGSIRLTFDNQNLQGGIQLIPMLIGLFAVPEIIYQTENAQNGNAQGISTTLPPPKQESDKYFTWHEFMPHAWNTLRSSFLGSFIGAMPGIGPAVASFLAYGAAKRKSKERAIFGEGAIDGVAAAEAANNAVCGAALIPLLTLSIPGDPVTAVLLGAFMVHDLTPGPLLFQEASSTIYAIFIALLISVVLMYQFAKIAIKFSAKLTHVRPYYMFPLVAVLCVIGSFAIQNEIFDAWLMLVFGLVGYIMRRLEFPTAPLLIAFLLGGMIENSLRQALIMSQNGWYIFITSPLSACFLALAAMGVIAIAMGKRKEYRAGKKSTNPA